MTITLNRCISCGLKSETQTCSRCQDIDKLMGNTLDETSKTDISNHAEEDEFYLDDNELFDLSRMRVYGRNPTLYDVYQATNKNTDL